MRNPKRPTLKQKKAIKANGLDPKNWNVVTQTADDLLIINKKSKKTRIIRY